jgi:choline dehydrogenase
MLFWLADPIGEPAAFTIECLLMRPRARGRVTLRSASPADPPRITLPSLDAGDVERLGEAAMRAYDVAMRPEMRALCAAARPPQDPAGLRAWVLESRYSVPHVVGTCAMGASPADGAVVDANARVHGVERLRVVDASILPEPPSGFPNLITMMAAEHIATTI